MKDPNCLICTPALCVHGEQSVTPEEVYQASLAEQLAAAKLQIAELALQLNTPEIHDFLEGVKREALHQRERWGTEQDSGKSDADWFWLVGYLVGKALHKDEKRLHHLITAAAALFNWHLYTVGKTNMRPGITPPPGGQP